MGWRVRRVGWMRAVYSRRIYLWRLLAAVAPAVLIRKAASIQGSYLFAQPIRVHGCAPLTFPKHLQAGGRVSGGGPLICEAYVPLCGAHTHPLRCLASRLGARRVQTFPTAPPEYMALKLPPPAELWPCDAPVHFWADHLANGAIRATVSWRQEAVELIFNLSHPTWIV